MTHEKFREVLERRFKLTEDVLANKSREYSSGEDKLHNFRVAAGYISGQPEQALWGFLVKHLVSIGDMIAELEDTSPDISREKWDEKVGDAINYLCLLDALIAERVERRDLARGETL